MAGRIDSTLIDRELAFHRCQYGVKELQVAVVLIAGANLPAGLFSLGIRQPAWSFQSLHVDDKGFRPHLLEVMCSGRVPGRAPMTVEVEYERRLAGAQLRG